MLSRGGGPAELREERGHPADWDGALLGAAWAQSGPQAAPSHQVPAAGRPASLLHTLCCTVFSRASAHVTSTLVFSNPCPLDLTWWLSFFSQYMCVCVFFCVSVCVTALLVQAKWQWRGRARSDGGGGGGHPALLPGCLQPGLPAPGAGERIPQGPLPPGEPNCPSLPVQTSWPW